MTKYISIGTPGHLDYLRERLSDKGIDTVIVGTGLSIHTIELDVGMYAMDEPCQDGQPQRHWPHGRKRANHSKYSPKDKK